MADCHCASARCDVRRRRLLGGRCLPGEEGHEVCGATLKLWGGTSDSGCCSVGDVDDARRVAQQVGIPHYVFDMTEAFQSCGRRPLRRCPWTGPDPQPLRRVQPPHQVRPAAPAGGAARIRRPGHRPPCAGGARRRDRLRAPTRSRPGQGPVLRALHARPGPARPSRPSHRNDDEGRGPRPGREHGAAHRGQARQPGRVLHPQRRRPPAIPGRSAALSPGEGGRHGNRHRRPGRWRRSSWSRSASAAGSITGPTAHVATSRRSTRCRPRSSSAGPRTWRCPRSR